VKRPEYWRGGTPNDSKEMSHRKKAHTHICRIRTSGITKQALEYKHWNEYTSLWGPNASAMFRNKQITLILHRFDENENIKDN
jgi:hypothetical protein